jgi:hypothetical protein
VIPGVNLPDSQVPFINPATGLVNRDWYRFLEAQFKYFGTMANQDADDVDITGGTITGVTYDGIAITNSTINSSVIGGTTPAAATFTTLAFSSGPIQVLTYTPTIVLSSNLDAVTPSDFFGLRVGDRALVGMRAVVNPTAGGSTATQFTFTLPWATTFAAGGQLTGTFASPNNDIAVLVNSPATSVGVCLFDSTFTAARTFAGTCSYLII